MFTSSPWAFLITMALLGRRGMGTNGCASTWSLDFVGAGGRGGAYAGTGGKSNTTCSASTLTPLSGEGSLVLDLLLDSVKTGGASVEIGGAGLEWDRRAFQFGVDGTSLPDSTPVLSALEEDEREWMSGGESLATSVFESFLAGFLLGRRGGFSPDWAGSGVLVGDVTLESVPLVSAEMGVKGVEGPGGIELAADPGVTGVAKLGVATLSEVDRERGGPLVHTEDGLTGECVGEDNAGTVWEMLTPDLLIL